MISLKKCIEIFFNTFFLFMMFLYIHFYFLTLSMYFRCYILALLFNQLCLSLKELFFLLKNFQL